MRLILLILIITSFAYSQYTNWEDKTAEQLSGITAGVTNIASKNYWTSNAYAQLKVVFDILGDMAIEATDTTELKAMPADTALYIVFLNQNADSLNGWYFKIDSANAEDGFNYFDCAEAGKQWKRYIGIPFPSSNLSADSIVVSADSGLGGGGVVNLGDTVNINVNVDSLSVSIKNDTLNVWRAFSKDHYPSYSNFIPWDLNDFQTDQDSVFICFWQEASSYKPYLEVKADSNSTDSQYVHLVYSFTAPRDVSDITDTLLIVEFKTSVADTDSVGCRLMLYEGTTARYTADSVTASTSWTTKAILKTHGTLTSVVTGDRFQLILRVKARTSAGATDPTTWISRIRERWY